VGPLSTALRVHERRSLRFEKIEAIGRRLEPGSELDLGSIELEPSVTMLR
jgi:hypothetical protein